jgi:hypothetical protein
MSARLYGGSSHSGSVTGISAVSGLIGMAASALLWLHQINPHNGLIRLIEQQVLGQTSGWTTLVTIAAVAGGLGLLVAILGAISSRDGRGAVFGIVLSLIALSYPFAYLAQQVSQPFSGGGPLHG